MSKKTLKIGIVGAGAIVRQRHAPGILKTGLAEIAAVSNSTPESARAFCSEFCPDAGVVGDWRDLVVREDLDIVWVGAGPVLHEPVTIAALEAGKHVFCQARMATDLGAAQRMVAAAEKRPELVTMLCPPPHGLAIDAYVKHLLAEKIVGDLRLVRLQSMNGAFLDPSAPPHWRQRKDISGKNVMTLGIHTEVLHRWLGPFSVEAANAAIFVAERAGTRIEIPDALTVLVTFPSGATGCLEFAGVYTGPPRDGLEIAGTTGSLTIDYLSEEIIFQQVGEAASVKLTPPKESLRSWQVEADFLNAVLHPDDPRPHPNFLDGLAYMEVVESVWEKCVAS
ncbi:MAG: Gfo/Idh/MocA family oxidoreductase [Terrimicrobiaceae bacterium]